MPRVPLVTVPLANADGTVNLPWWRFFARLGGGTAVAAPSGGTVVDVEARAAIAALLAELNK